MHASNIFDLVFMLVEENKKDFRYNIFLSENITDPFLLQNDCLKHLLVLCACFTHYFLNFCSHKLRK